MVLPINPYEQNQPSLAGGQNPIIPDDDKDEEGSRSRFGRDDEDDDKISASDSPFSKDSSSAYKVLEQVVKLKTKDVILQSGEETYAIKMIFASMLVIICLTVEQQEGSALDIL